MLFSKFFKLLLSNFLNLFTPNDVEFVFVFQPCLNRDLEPRSFLIVRFPIPLPWELGDSMCFMFCIVHTRTTYPWSLGDLPTTSSLNARAGGAAHGLSCSTFLRAMFEPHLVLAASILVQDLVFAPPSLDFICIPDWFAFVSLNILLAQTRSGLEGPWAPTFFLCPRIDGAGDIRKDERREGRGRRCGRTEGTGFLERLCRLHEWDTFTPSIAR